MSLSGENIQTGSKSVWRASMLLAWIGLIAAGAVFVVVLAANHLDGSQSFPPEIVLPLVVIVGVVVLLATLAITAATFGLFEMSDKGQALGLPAGSVQAVIALSLILIFAVVALYASSSSGNKEYTSTGVSSTELQSIPPEQIVSKQVENGGSEPTYTVVRSVEDRDLKDINTQLLTTVSTLVIAVAGFYFGSKSVQEGNKAAIEAAAPNRSLTLLTPASPTSMEAVERLQIKLQSVPPGAQLNWSLHDDPRGQLLRRPSGEFVYTPGGDMPQSGKSASLIFEQVEDPSTSATLVVNFPKADDEKSKPTPSDGEPDAQPGTDEMTEHERAVERQAHLKETAAGKKPRLKRGDDEPPEAPGSAPPEATI